MQLRLFLHILQLLLIHPKISCSSVGTIAHVPTDALGEVRMALKELAKATMRMHEVLKQRLAAVGPGEEMRVTHGI